MDTSKYLAAKKYVEDAVCRGVQTVIPASLTRPVGCSKEEALAIMFELQEQEVVEGRASVQCPSCEEHIPLKGRTLQETADYLKRIAGEPCWSCKRRLPDASELAVEFSFFCAAAVQQALAAVNSAPAENSNVAERKYTLDEIERVVKIAARLRPEINVVGNGNVLNSGTTQAGNVGGVSATASASFGDGSKAIVQQRTDAGGKVAQRAALPLAAALALIGTWIKTRGSQPLWWFDAIAAILILLCFWMMVRAWSSSAAGGKQ